MLSLFSVVGLLSGTALTCYAPMTRHEHELDVVGAAAVVVALATIGFRFAPIYCIH